MRELAEALKKRAGLRMRQGVVSAVTGSTCSVFVGGSSVPVDGVQHLNSCSPQAGDVVWITSDGADLWIVGTHGDPPPIDPALLPTFETYFTDADTPGAPSPVAGLAGAAGFTQITLSWALPPEAMWRTWQVFEGTTSGFTPGTPVLTTDKTVVSIAHVTGSGPWYYKVRAINSLGVASTDVQVGPFTLAAVTAVDIGPGSVLATKLAANAVDLASAVVTGQVAAAKLADNAVTQAKIAAGAVGTAELAAGSVIAGKIAAGTIVAADIAANTITGGNIAANSIVGANIGAGTLTANEIAADAITTAKIAAGAVTTNELAALSVTAAKIAAGTITGDKIVAGTITSSNIAAGSIYTADLNVADVQAGIVTAARINALTLNAIEITGGTITGTTIRTAASGARTELISTFQGVKFYSGQTGETAPGSIASATTGFLKDVVITSPNFGSGVASIRISKEFGSLGMVTLDAEVAQATGHIYVGGRVDIQTDWSEQGSNDGIWIQDSFYGSERWHLYFNSNTKRLTVSNGTTPYSVVLA